MKTSSNKETVLCGWGPFRPGWLQRFHNPVCLTLAIGLSMCLQGMLLAGFLPGANAILEKRFFISNTDLSYITIVDEVFSVIALLFVSHFAEKGHKGKWLAAGTIIFSTGAILYTIPQFAVGPYDFAGRQKEVTYCQKTVNSTCPEKPASSEGNIHNYFYLFMFAEVLIGIGTSPLPILAPTYVDENVSQRRSPVFLAFLMASRGCGPLIGASLGAIFLRIWGDVGKVDIGEITITPDDDRWYGAWWLGFILVGILGFFAALPLLAFAKKLPGADEERKNDRDQAFRRRNRKSFVPENQKLKDAPKAVLKLFTNSVFVCIALSHIFVGYIISALGPFLVKILEMLFRISTSDATLVKGLVITLGFASGGLAGGFLISKLKLKLLGMLTMAAILTLISAFLTPIFFLHCEPAHIVGINLKYPGASEIKLDDGCNVGCGCPAIGYQPVCDTVGDVAFYSPCFAGCTHNSSGKMWQDCACIKVEKNETRLATVSEGLCGKYCPWFPLFVALFAVMAFLMGMHLPSVEQSFLRSVEFHQRTLALSVSWILSRLLGMIPGALIFGRLLDLACLFNERDLPKPPSNCTASGGPTRCIRYDIDQVALTLSTYMLSLKLVIIVCLSMGAFLYWRNRKGKSVEPADPQPSVTEGNAEATKL